MKFDSKYHIAIAHAVLTAVALSVAVSANELAATATATATAAAVAVADDEESDSAAFTVVVDHGDGWRCNAALVSLRTALTSAQCARGPRGGGGGEVWARAPFPAAAATRVLRVAEAAGADLDAEAQWEAHAARRDVALLELAAALAAARPVLLAASRADCDPHAVCHLVRALGSGPAGTRLRIVELRVAGGSACWPPDSALAGPSSHEDERPMCLAGPDLCQSDHGAGIVCGGKLCGVLSRSRVAAGGCGSPHAAASAPRWRRFLHCAHMRGACGRDGECGRLCTERWLVDDSEEAVVHTEALPAPLDSLFASLPPSALDHSLESETPDRTILTEESVAHGTQTMSPPTRSSPAPLLAFPLASPLASPLAPPALVGAASTVRHAFEFEPNRADFTMQPAPHTRVVFKAGEYGDNAADYQAPQEDPSTAAPPVPAPQPPAPPEPPAPSARRGPRLQARVSPARVAALSPPPPRLLTDLLLYLGLTIWAFK